MKYLRDYIEEGQTKAITKAGAFFAFSDKQFDEASKAGIKYVNLFAGLVCPKDTAKQLLVELEEVNEAGIKQDIAENGTEGVVKRELENHEAYYTGDISSTVDALSLYQIPLEDIKRIFKASDYTRVS